MIFDLIFINHIFYRTNNQIRAKEVRLIDEKGQNLGIFPTEEAIKIAKEKGLDLVEISSSVTPLIARILDFGQFLYQQRKKNQKQRTKQKKVKIKGIRLSLRISEHDLNLKVNQAKKFLDEGHKVKIEMNLRGRERMHADLAREIIKRFISLSGEKIILEQEITKMGGRLTCIVIKS